MKSLLQDMIDDGKRFVDAGMSVSSYIPYKVWEVGKLLGVLITIKPDSSVCRPKEWWGHAIWMGKDVKIVLHPCAFELGEDCFIILLIHEFAHCLTPGAHHGPKFISMFEDISGMKYDDAEHLLKEKEKEFSRRVAASGIVGLEKHEKDIIDLEVKESFDAAFSMTQEDSETRAWLEKYSNLWCNPGLWAGYMPR